MANHKWLIPFCFLPFSLFGVVGQWAVDANGDWETATNWSSNPQIPNAIGDTATFDTAIPLTGGRTVTLNSSKVVGILNFQGATAQNFQVTGSSLTLQNAGNAQLNVSGAGQHSIASGMVLSSDLDANVAVNFTITGAVSGSGALNKSGAGDLIFNGSSSNSFTGLTTVTAGGLQLNMSGGAVAIAGDLTIPGGTVTLGQIDQISDTSAVTVSGGTLAFGSNSDTIGSLTYSSGTITAGASTVILVSDNTTALSLSGGVNLAINTGFSGSGSLDVAGAGNQITADLDMGTSSHDFNIPAGADLTITGVISNSGGFVMADAGALTISGATANTYTGLTQVDAGTVTLSKATGPAVGGNLKINAGTVTMTAADQIANGSIVTLSGGTLNMGGNNDTIGGLVFQSGTLNQGGATLTMSSNNTALTMRDQTISDPIAFTGSGAIVFDATNNNTAIISSTVDLGTQPHVFAIANGSGNPDMDIQGVISNGGGITKTGPGTLQLSGGGGGANPNTYSGLTTVSQGEVILNTNASVVAIPGDLIISGGTVTQTAVDQIASSSTVTLNSGTWDLGGNNSSVESFFFNGGTFTQGAGVLTLNANSPTTALSMRDTTISGDVTISGTGAVAFDATNNGTATISSTTTLDLGGAVTNFNIASGSAAVDMDIQGVITNGGMNKNQGGTLRFFGSAANTYVGDTTVNAGELLLAKNAGVNAIPGNVVTINGGTLTLQNNEQIVDTAVMTINGGLFDMQGTTETITTLNFLGGNFNQLSGGDLILQGGGNALTMRDTTLSGNVTTTGGGSIVFDATNNGTAQMLGTLNLSGATTFDIQNGTADDDMVIYSTITSGGVIKDGTGTLVLLGPNTYGGGTTITDGILQGTTTSLQGAIGGAAAGTLVFDQGFNGSFGGTISMDSALIKEGSGTVIFPAPVVQTVNGTTTINDGILQVDGTLVGTGSVLVNGGGTLGGSGTVNQDVAVNGTIAPGSGGIGTLTVGGNVTMNSGSTLSIEITPSSNDQLALSGTYTIDPNATFFFDPLPGSYPTGESYTVVQGGVIAGQFGAINDPYPLFDGTLQYLADSILLQLDLVPISSLTGLNQNAQKVAACLDAESPTPGEDLFVVVNRLRFLPTIEKINEALLAMQPSSFVSLAVIKQDNTLYVRNAIYDRLELRARSCMKEKTGLSFWLAPFVGVSLEDDHDKAPGYNVLTPGAAIGLDGMIGTHFQLGGALGYTNADITWKHNRAVGRAQGFYVSLYGRYGNEIVNLETALMGGYDYYTTNREIKFGGLLPLHRHAKGSHHGWEGSAHLKGTLQLPVGHTKFGPYLGIDYLYLHERGFTETGAKSLNLRVEGKSATLLLSEGGMAISHCFHLQNKTVTPFAQIGALWENRFTGETETSHLTACTLHNTGYYPSRVLFNPKVGFNVKWGLKNAPRASFTYNGKYAHGYQDHSFTLDLIY